MNLGRRADECVRPHMCIFRPIPLIEPMVVRRVASVHIHPVE
jgi:hypothetical protein